MWKYVMSVLLVIAGVALLFPRGEQAPAPETVTPAAELQMKQMTLNQDLARTDELCRSECSMVLHRTVQELRTKESGQVMETLKKSTSRASSHGTARLDQNTAAVRAKCGSRRFAGHGSSDDRALP